MNMASRATNKTCGLGQALGVEAVSHQYERTRRKKEHNSELKQQSNRWKHAFLHQRPGSTERGVKKTRASLQTEKEKESGHSATGRERGRNNRRLWDGSPRPRLQTSPSCGSHAGYCRARSSTRTLTRTSLVRVKRDYVTHHTRGVTRGGSRHKNVTTGHGNSVGKEPRRKESAIESDRGDEVGCVWVLLRLPVYYKRVMRVLDDLKVVTMT
ncbi:hypothetical protein EDB84DRAFT_1675471 [Lactarius hengduanensis]|nr:hypothetical protein EDB84DRAFT_1675471 [Lactarius hengduanensis]